jgi:hypothetical protein
MDDKIGIDLPDRVRDGGLTGVASLIYQAVSPDKYDGLSDAEYLALVNNGIPLFELWELGKRVGLPGLPQGFAKHFRNDVIPDITQVRADPVARQLVREQLEAILNDPERIAGLYREGGDTFSEILDAATRHQRFLPGGSVRPIGPQANTSNEGFIRQGSNRGTRKAKK